MIPIMLLGKPLYKKFGGGRTQRRNYEQMSDELLGDDEGHHEEVAHVSQVLFNAVHSSQLFKNSIKVFSYAKYCECNETDITLEF